jgi:type I restriction enzyme S subunit
MKSQKKASPQQSNLFDELELPEGWTLKKIRDLVTINYGKGLKDADRAGGSVSVYGSNGIVGSHNKALTDGPSIIIGRKGSIGEVHYSANPSWPIDTTYYIDKFEGIEPTFLVFALKSLNLSDLDTSTAIPGLNRNDIYDQEIPLPSLSEQQCIVARVEALLTHVNAARDRLNRVPLFMKKFRQAVLAAACSGRLTEGWREENPQSSSDQINQKILQKMEKIQILHNFEWDENFTLPTNWILTFIEIVAKVDTGTTPSRKNADYWDNGSIPWVTSGELYDPFITDTKEKISEIALKETRLKIFPKGTLLIALYGQGITRGKSSELLIEATTNQACGTINVFEDFSPIKPYLKLYLQKNYDDIRKLSSGGVQPNLNSSKIKAMPIPLPPLAEQHEIVRRVSLLFERADAFDKEVVAASRRCERLTQAVLGNAFSGKL